MSNPQAFPMTWVKQEAPNLNVILEQRGMTLRDYFAAKAMQSLLATPQNVAQAIKSLGVEPDEASIYMAAGAYSIADAMLKAREQ